MGVYVHPLCGKDMQDGTKMIAIFQIIWYTLHTVLFGIFSTFGSKRLFGNNRHQEKYEIRKQIEQIEEGGAFLMGFVWVICLLYVLVGILLLFGAIRRDVGKCKSWLIFSVLLLVISILGVITKFVQGPWGVAIYGLGHVFLQSYFVWIVYSFYRELIEPESVGWNGNARPKAFNF